MNKTLTLFSPAKVNLFFRVLNRRSDGYHDVASLYQAVSLGDTLDISLAEQDSITCDHPGVPCDERNLCIKALNVFRQKTGCSHKVHIHLHKKIPMQAGLGGGSSNAATTLFALNALLSTSVDEHTLAKWSSEFSSDAPFFFSTGTAYGTGRGEQLMDLPALSSTFFWLAKPQEGLSTPAVYKHCVPDSFMQRDPKRYLNTALSGQLETFNDLETPAFDLMPSLKTLKTDLLQLGFSQATMTGSGTAFMCFGNISQPALSGIWFFPLHFIHRVRGEWYKCPPL